MNKTKPKATQPPAGSPPNSPPVHGKPVHGKRSVLKCRCGGLYLNPDAHRDAFGHRPEPVAA